MIRTLLALLPSGSGRTVLTHVVLTVVGLVLRAGGIVLLVPLVAALFGDEPGNAWIYLALLAGVTVAGWLVDAAAARRAFDLGFGLLSTGQSAVADRISTIRLDWLAGDNLSTTRQAVAATGPDLVGIIVYLVNPIIGSILLPVFIAVALLPLSWPLALAALAGVPILLGAFLLAGGLGRSADRAAAQTNAELSERIIEFARSQQALRASRRVEPARSHAGAALTAHYGATMKLLIRQIPGQVVFSVASQLALILLAGTTVLLTARGEITAPEAIALIVVIVRYLEPFTMLAELSPGIETTTGSLRRIREVLGAPAVGSGTRRAEISAAPTIEWRGIRFGYDAGDPRPVFDGFDLTLEPGSTTAIVGPSGSGKSTLLALLAGLHDPDSGSIRIGGVDVRDLDAHARRGLVSVLFQQPYLFDGGIRENILTGDPDASQKAWRRAAELARVDTLAARLSDGWGTRVGEAGGTLSGGERQRVSIARALLKPAPVLLVDEATSALDAENESAVAAALTDDETPRTRVIVAHRLSSIRAADRVVFLDEGRIVEDGSIDDLLAADGRFAAFWRQQHAASAWRLGTSTAEEPV